MDKKEFEERMAEEEVEVTEMVPVKKPKKSLKERLKKPALIAGGIIAALAVYNKGKATGKLEAKAELYDDLDDIDETDEEEEN